MGEGRGRFFSTVVTLGVAVLAMLGLRGDRKIADADAQEIQTAVAAQGEAGDDSPDGYETLSYEVMKPIIEKWRDSKWNPSDGKSRHFNMHEETETLLLVLERFFDIIMKPIYESVAAGGLEPYLNKAAAENFEKTVKETATFERLPLSDKAKDAALKKVSGIRFDTSGHWQNFVSKMEKELLRMFEEAGISSEKLDELQRYSDERWEYFSEKSTSARSEYPNKGQLDRNFHFSVISAAIGTRRALLQDQKTGGFVDRVEAEEAAPLSRIQQ